MASLARSAHVLGITLLVIAAVMITSTPFVECRAVERPRAAMVNSDPRAADRFEKSRLRWCIRILMPHTGLRRVVLVLTTSPHWR
ncbi:hypothetical protein SEVIR_9G299048v4 [Setaria viridis]